MLAGSDRTGIEFEVEVAGRRYQGWYYIGDDEVTVCSALGDATVPLSGETPGAAARTVLRKLVDDGLA